MKKILFLLLSAFLSLNAFAEDTPSLLDYESESDALYVTGTLQTGAKGNLYLMMKNTATIGTVCCSFTLPEGITISDEDVALIYSNVTSFARQKDGVTYKLAYNHQFNASETPVVVATLPVTCTAAVGKYQVVAQEYQMVHPDLTDIYVSNVYTEVTVQSTAVIDELPSDYALEVIPFAAKSGVNTFDIMFKAPEVIKDLEFDVTLPKGMFFYNTDFDVTVPTYVAGATATAPTFTIQNTDETTCHVKVAGAYNKLKKTSTGMDATSSLIKAFTVNTYVFTDDEVVDCELGEAYIAPNNSVQQLKISNIKMGNGDASNVYEGKAYLTSVFYGTPAEKDPVLYGHYTKDIISTLNGGVAKNFCTVDMTAATVDEGCKVNDALVYTADKTTYDRSITTTYGTVCLPIEATGTFYTLSAATADKLTFTPLEGKLPANTPAIFSGAISAAAEGTVTPGTPGTGATANGLTLTGTYKTFELADGAGYFISQDKFYNDGATVKAFRSYFTGTISSGAKALRIEIEDANGVRDITDQLSDQDIFNLQGIRVQTAKKGVNIINGKKVYVK